MSKEEVNIDTGQMIYYHTLYVNPFRSVSPDIVYEGAVEELKKSMAESGARIDKPYKITLKMEEL